MAKTFATYQQQINKLCGDGLSVNDVTYAEEQPSPSSSLMQTKKNGTVEDSCALSDAIAHIPSAGNSAATASNSRCCRYASLSSRLLYAR